MSCNCQDAAGLLEKKINGRISAADDRRLTDHLATCADCRAELTQLEAWEELLAGALAPVPVPASFRDEVMTRIENLEQAESWALRAARYFYYRKQAFKVGAAVAAASLLFWGVGTAASWDFLPRILVPSGEFPSGDVNGTEDPPVVIPGVEDPRDPQIPTDGVPGDPDAEPGIEEPVTEEPSVGEPGQEPAVDPTQPVTDPTPSPGRGGTPPAVAQEPVTRPDPEPTTPDDERDVSDVDLSGQTRLDETVRIASQSVGLMSGTLVLEDVYVRRDAEALAPSLGSDGETIFFLKENGNAQYDMVGLEPDGASVSVMVEDVESNPYRITRDATTLNRKGLREEDGALFFGNKQLTPALVDVAADYARAPDGVVVAINARSDQREVEGLWITDINQGQLRKLSAQGGGRILGWSPDGDLVVYTNKAGDVYMSSLHRDRTYLVAARGDTIQTAKVTWSPEGDRLLLGAYVGGRNGIYEVKLP